MEIKWIRMVIVVLLVKEENLKESECFLVGRWLNKIRYIYDVVFKKDEGK